MDFESIMNLVKNMLPSSVVTLEIFFLTIIFSSILGMFVAFGRMSKYAIIRVPVQAFLLVMRGTPLILQLMFFYFAPYYIFHATLPRFWAAILAFTLNYSAYIAEIYRSGIESIPVGQYEAATVLGFGKAETFFKIILPQVIKRIIPPFSNELMTLVKDTALAQVIGVAEIFKLAGATMSSQFSTVPLIVAGVFYLIMNTVVERFCFYLEKKLDYYE
ncbi:MAG: amino acid ABC transporter permease [Intestinibacter sp.]|uniref:amino acid ABC transporter permease n=1 Tax=Intestinibacter sp. TaxID=1965304 RepID=UPI003F144313